MKRHLLGGIAAFALIAALPAMADAQSASSGGSVSSAPSSAPSSTSDQTATSPGSSGMGGSGMSGSGMGMGGSGMGMGGSGMGMHGSGAASGDQTAATGDTATTFRSAQSNMSGEIAELKSMTSLSAGDVRVINADAMAGAAGTASVPPAGSDQMTSLHDAIRGNTALKSALDKQNVKIEDVVAVDVGSDGKVTVFTQKSKG